MIFVNIGIQRPAPAMGHAPLLILFANQFCLRITVQFYIDKGMSKKNANDTKERKFPQKQ
jgi:hypothetical protein